MGFYHNFTMFNATYTLNIVHDWIPLLGNRHLLVDAKIEQQAFDSKKKLFALKKIPEYLKIPFIEEAGATIEIITFVSIIVSE